MKLRHAVLIMLISQSCYASPKPEHCPSPEAIKKISVDCVDREPLGSTWVASIKGNRYDTNVSWRVSIASIQAKNAEEARSKAKSIIASMITQGEPQPFFDQWLCDYTTTEGKAIAVTPAEIVCS